MAPEFKLPKGFGELERAAEAARLRIANEARLREEAIRAEAEAVAAQQNGPLDIGIPSDRAPGGAIGTPDAPELPPVEPPSSGGGLPPIDGGAPPVPPKPPENWFQPESFGAPIQRVSEPGKLETFIARGGTMSDWMRQQAPETHRSLQVMADAIEGRPLSRDMAALEEARDKGRPTLDQVLEVEASGDQKALAKLNEQLKFGGVTSKIERNRLQIYDQIKKTNQPVIESYKADASNLEKVQTARQELIRENIGDEAITEIKRGVKDGKAPDEIFKPFDELYKNGAIDDVTLAEVRKFVYSDYAFGERYKPMIAMMRGVVPEALPRWYSYRAFLDTPENKRFFEDRGRIADEVGPSSNSDPLSSRKWESIEGFEDKYTDIPQSYVMAANNLEELLLNSAEVKRQAAYAAAVPELAPDMPALNRNYFQRVAEKLDEAKGDHDLASRLIEMENEGIHERVKAELGRNIIKESIPGMENQNIARLNAVMDRFKFPIKNGPAAKALGKVNQVVLSVSPGTIATSGLGDSVNSIRDIGLTNTLKGMRETMKGTPFSDAWNDSVAKSSQAVKGAFKKNPKEAAKLYANFLYNLVNAPRNVIESFNRRAAYDGAEIALLEGTRPAAKSAFKALGELAGEAKAELAMRQVARERIAEAKKLGLEPDPQDIRTLQHHGAALRIALDDVAGQSRPTGVLSETVLQARLKTGKPGSLNISPVLMNQSFFLLGLAKQFRLISGLSALDMSPKEKVKYAAIALGIMSAFGTTMGAVMKPLVSNVADKRNEEGTADDLIAAISFGVGLNPYLFQGSFGHDPFSIQNIPSNVARVFTPAPLNKMANISQDLFNMAKPEKTRIAASGNVVKAGRQAERPVPKILGDITGFAPLSVNVYGMISGAPAPKPKSSTRAGMDRQRQMNGLVP